MPARIIVLSVAIVTVPQSLQKVVERNDWRHESTGDWDDCRKLAGLVAVQTSLVVLVTSRRVQSVWKRKKARKSSSEFLGFVLSGKLFFRSTLLC